MSPAGPSYDSGSDRAPVFGRPDAAAAAKIFIAVAGPADQIARCQSLFDATAIYWHFMGVLWLYLLFVIGTKL